MDDLEYRVGKLTLGAGDILVLKLDHALTMQNLQRLLDQARAVLGPEARIMALPPWIDLSVITAAQVEALAAGQPLATFDPLQALRVGAPGPLVDRLPTGGLI